MTFGLLCTWPVQWVSLVGSGETPQYRRKKLSTCPHSHYNTTLFLICLSVFSSLALLNLHHHFCMRPSLWNDFHLLCRVTLLQVGGEKGNIRKIVQRCESGTVLFVKMFLLDGVNKWIAYCRLSVQDAQIFMISGFSSSWIFISLSWIRIRPHLRQSAAHVSVQLYEGIFITVQSLVSQPGVRPTIF